MSLTRSVEEIRQMFLERSDTLDASSYEVLDLCDEVIRLREIVVELSKNPALRAIEREAIITDLRAALILKTQECERLRAVLEHYANRHKCDWAIEALSVEQEGQ